MSYVLKCLGLAAGSSTFAGEYLQEYDPDAQDGRGWVVWTPHVAQALVFEDAGEALELWRRTSTVRPLRPDGRPNRPLTAFTVEAVQLR